MHFRKGIKGGEEEQPNIKSDRKLDGDGVSFVVRHDVGAPRATSHPTKNTNLQREV